MFRLSAWFAAFFLMLICLTPEKAAARVVQTAPGNCLIEIDDRVLIDKPCPYIHEQMQIALNFKQGGSEPYVLVTRENETTAGAVFHANPNDLNNNGLGYLTRDGDCWSNDRARVCIPLAAAAALDRDWSEIVAEASPPFPYNCLIKVDGDTLFRAPCPVFTEDGFVTINGSNTWFLQPISVAIYPDSDGRHQARLHDDARDPQDIDLGAVSRQGDCWVNDRARLCMTSISPAP